MAGNNTNKGKKPPLTHFLCLPLVNSTSLPQLESSLASFKAAIPLRPHQHLHPRAPAQPLIPDGAMRPVGTLHLTLGVMSLPTRERLDEALALFESLDLSSMAREAETKARRSKSWKQSGSKGDGCSECALESTSRTGAPKPLRISLESLHALPRPRAATVLHAAPVDASSRLYPFCEMLRDKFLEAGFLVSETKQKSNGKAARKIENTNPSQNASEQQSTLQERPTELPPEPGFSQSYSSQSAPAPKPRPLLLHATVVNTIYVKGRQRSGPPNRNNNGNRNHRTNRYSFDARDIVAQCRDYYVDSLRTEPRAVQGGLLTSAVQAEEKEANQEEAGDVSSGNEDENDNDNQVSHTQSGVRYPFLWAKDFPLESICICEMGAKKLDTDNDATGLNGRLREKYTIVAERSLDFESAQQTTRMRG